MKRKHFIERKNQTCWRKTKNHQWVTCEWFSKGERVNLICGGLKVRRIGVNVYSILKWSQENHFRVQWKRGN